MHDFTDQLKRAETLNWAQRVRKLLALEGDHDGVAAIDSAVEQFSNDKTCIGVIGQSKRGKSTLVNALLGRTDDLVAPVDVLPASNAVSRFFQGPVDRATVFFTDGGSQQIHFVQIRQYVTEAGNPGNRKGVCYLDVQSPFLGTDPNVILVDVPGAGSVNEQYDLLVQNFLHSADAVIFLLGAERPIERTQLELLRRVQENQVKKIFFALNQIDRVSASDLKDVTEYNEHALADAGIHHNAMHSISAYQAMQGQAGRGGLDPLICEIRSFLSSGGLAEKTAEFRQRVEVAATPLAARYDAEFSDGGGNRTGLDRQIAELETAKSSMAADAQAVDQRFLDEWNIAIDIFEQSLAQIERDVKRHFNAMVSGTGTLEAKALETKLPAMVEGDIDRRIGPADRRLHDALVECSQQLHRTVVLSSLKNTTGNAAGDSSGQHTGEKAVHGAGAASLGSGMLAHPAGNWIAKRVLGSGISAVARHVTGYSGGGTALKAVKAVAEPALLLAGGTVAVGAVVAGTFAITALWTHSLLKHKHNLPLAVGDLIGERFSELRTQRLPELRLEGKIQLKQYRLTVKKQLDRIEASITSARGRRPAEQEMAALAQRRAEMKTLLPDLWGADHPSVGGSS